jgi:hypothetical protein
MKWLLFSRDALQPLTHMLACIVHPQPQNCGLVVGDPVCIFIDKDSEIHKWPHEQLPTVQAKVSKTMHAKPHGRIDVFD